MGLCNPLICFFTGTQAIIKSSKETCTADTFQEKNKTENRDRRNTKRKNAKQKKLPPYNAQVPESEPEYILSGSESWNPLAPGT